MNLSFKSAEKVLGITCNQLALRNTLNDSALYNSIIEFKQNFSSNIIDEQRSKVSTFISLLYAKAISINGEDSPVLFWQQRNGLLQKHFQLATAVDLIVEANNLSVLEYKLFKKITKDSLSTRLYFKSLDLVKQLNNERIYLDLKQSINSFHLGLNKWSKFEENFFNQIEQPNTKLTFDNYSDYVLLIKDQNLLIRNWEEYVQSTYGNLLGYVCSSMALLGDHNYNTWKRSFDFGSNFAFNYIVNQQFTSYFNESDKETCNNLQLPILIYLKLVKDDDKRKHLIDGILNKHNCSSSALQLKSEIKNSNDTLKQIKQYGRTYLNQTNNCLSKLQESDSKLALLQISNSLLDF